MRYKYENIQLSARIKVLEEELWDTKKKLYKEIKLNKLGDEIIEDQRQRLQRSRDDQ